MHWVFASWYLSRKSPLEKVICAAVPFKLQSVPQLAFPIVEACAKHGITLFNMHEPLGTRERIQSLLTQAEFSQIEIYPRQLGTYLTLEKAQNRWDGQFWLHPDNPLRKLEPEKIRQIKVSYRDDGIAALETEQGVWHEKLIYYVVART